MGNNILKGKKEYFNEWYFGENYYVKLRYYNVKNWIKWVDNFENGLNMDFEKNGNVMDDIGFD